MGVVLCRNAVYPCLLGVGKELGHDKLTKNQRVKRRTENEVIIEIMALRALVVSYCRTSIVLGFGEHI